MDLALSVITQRQGGPTLRLLQSYIFFARHRKGMTGTSHTSRRTNYTIVVHPRLEFILKQG